MDAFEEVRRIKELICSIQSEIPDNVLRIYFSEKRPLGKYRTFKPQVSNDLQHKILSLVLPQLTKSLELPIVSYNPVGVLDEQNEFITTTQVCCVDSFKDSSSDGNLITQIDLIKPSTISFYCIEILHQGNSIYLFRQFAKINRLRKGIISRITNGELKELDNDFLSIDEFTDLVLMGDMLLIFNHIALERIFNYKDQFQEITKKAIHRIIAEGKMANADQFSDDCLKDIRVMKRFTELMSKERLPLFFMNYDRVPSIVADLALDIQFDSEGKMIYRDKSQLFHIIHLMSDSYFRSLIAERVGIAEIEGTI